MPYEQKLRHCWERADWKVFDDLYDQRSKFLHEGAGAGTLADAAEKALGIARRLLLADIAATREGS